MVLFAIVNHGQSNFLFVLSVIQSRSFYSIRFAYKIISKYHLLPNKERSYVYLSLLVDSSVASQLITDIDSVLQAFNLPGYHEDSENGPILHVSIARCLYSLLPEDSIGGVHVFPVDSSSASSTDDSLLSTFWWSCSSSSEGDGGSNEIEMIIEEDAVTTYSNNSSSNGHGSSNNGLGLLLDYNDNDDNDGNDDKEEKKEGNTAIFAIQKPCSALSLQIGDRIFIKQLLLQSGEASGFIEQSTALL